MSYPKATLRLTMALLAAISCLTWAAPARSQGLIDVNTASAEQLEQLSGIGPSRARAIIEHREANGPFTSIESLTDVRGIGPGILSRIRDRITLGEGTAQAAPQVTRSASQASEPAPRAPPERAGPAAGSSRDADDGFDLDLTRDDQGAGMPVRRDPPEQRQAVRADVRADPPAATEPRAATATAPSGLININTADEETLVRLRGVGPARAGAIIAHRSSQGPFRSTEDIMEVSGIGPATYNGFRHLITVQLDLNSAGLEELEAIGIDMQAAERIIAWRRTSGPFRSVEQLTEVPGFGRGALETLGPFLWVGNE